MLGSISKKRYIGFKLTNKNRYGGGNMKYSRRIKIATLRYENVSILAKLLMHFDQINPNVAGLISDPKTRNMFSNADLRLLLGNTARFKLFMFGASLEGLKMGAFPKMPRLYDFSEIQNYKKKNYLRYGDLVVEEFGEKASQVESEIYSIDIPKSFTKEDSFLTSASLTPNCSATIFLTRCSILSMCHSLSYCIKY